MAVQTQGERPGPDFERDFLPLVKNHLFHPYRGTPRVLSQAEYSTFQLKRLRATAGATPHPLDIFLVSRRDHLPIGLLLGTYAAWDSSYFSRKVVKIEELLASGTPPQRKATFRNLLSAFMEQCTTRGIDYLLVRIDLRDSEAMQVLLEYGFQIAAYEGVNIATSCSLHGSTALPMAMELRMMRPSDHHEVISLAKEASTRTKSHYTLAGTLPDSLTKGYYEELMLNCCRGNLDGKVLIASLHNKLAGFFAYALPQAFAEITGRTKAFPLLFAVNSSLQGHGFAQAFMMAARQEILKKADFIEGRVYLHNYPMVRLLAHFESMVFRQYICCLHRDLKH